MKKEILPGKKKKILLAIILGIALLTIGFVVASAQAIPYRIITKYPAGMILEEAKTMHQCGECHDTEEFHTCDTCHNSHGSARLSDITFNTTIHLTGDVPKDQFIPSNQVFLVDKKPEDEISINDFLGNQGINSFKSITLYSNDGGFTTIAKDQLSETSLLLPYEDSIRFADEKLHVSTWLKGISKIIVVGDERKLVIDGNEVSFGELLLKDTVQFMVEQAPVMLKNEADGLIRTGYTAERLEGIEVSRLILLDDEKEYLLEMENGTIQKLGGTELKNSKLVLIGPDIVLVFPDKSRNTWLRQIVSITEES